MADGGGLTEQDRSEGMPSLGEAPNERGKSPWLLGAFPSDSPSGRNRQRPLPQKRIGTPMFLNGASAQPMLPYVTPPSAATAQPFQSQRP
ncbi:hypothetical protein EKG40_14645 [Pseudomonas moorei]|nr:hypothetical protein EKG40_14645 [Pseudomonas moorei]